MNYLLLDVPNVTIIVYKNCRYQINRIVIEALQDMVGGESMRCDKCGTLIEGGRIKLIQHKKECHSY